MASRSNARYLAPLALGAFAIVFLIVFVSTGSDGGSEAPKAAPARTAPRPAASRTSTTTTTTPRFSTERVYTVRSGDILSTIAEKTGVSVDRLQQLNPDVDPQALVAGQKLKLRP